MRKRTSATTGKCSIRSDLAIAPPNLKDFFKLIERGEKKLPDLLANILVRCTRNHILRWYGFDAETHEPVDPSRFQEYLDGRRRAYVLVGGKHQFFPKRQLQTIAYSIEDTYPVIFAFNFLPEIGIEKRLKPRQKKRSRAMSTFWERLSEAL